MANTEFKDSVEATEFMEKLHSMLRDPRLLDWAQETDDNFSTITDQSLQSAQASYTAFMNDMYEAGE